MNNNVFGSKYRITGFDCTKRHFHLQKISRLLLTLIMGIPRLGIERRNGSGVRGSVYGVIVYDFGTNRVDGSDETLNVI